MRKIFVFFTFTQLIFTPILFGQDTGVLYTYTVRDIWPSEIGSIDLSYESSDAIEEFTVTFQVNYMERGEGAQAPNPPSSQIPQTATV